VPCALRRQNAAVAKMLHNKKFRFVPNICHLFKRAMVRCGAA
jgi:hypothetical protein